MPAFVIACGFYTVVRSVSDIYQHVDVYIEHAMLN